MSVAHPVYYYNLLRCVYMLTNNHKNHRKNIFKWFFKITIALIVSKRNRFFSSIHNIFVMGNI